jgi:hypothetical protein
VRIDPLWWRHVRQPRQHISEPHQGARVIDRDKHITMLDPDTSQFTTLLMLLGGGPAISRFPESHHLTTVGDFVRDPKTGRVGRIIDRPLVTPDDWFTTKREVLVEWEPSDASFSVKHSWLEDEMFPRINRPSFW